MSGILVGTIVASEAVASTNTVTVTIDSGALAGSLNDAVLSFKGIPYAEPPVGELRWRAPKPVAPWPGRRDATSFGAPCMQPESHASLPPPSPVIPPIGKMSEDCLTLNVWTSADHGEAKRPVMVWFHGGGFYMGSAAWPTYDGAALARDGVVVVTVNYRLGAFGFFAHPALSKESTDAPVTNFGLLDMIESLRWVQRNIANFGGDPDNVTIFGESAGGISVNLLMSSPLANGLFHRAIAQSALTWEPLRRLTGISDSAERWGFDWAAQLGVGQDLKALRAVPAETILAHSMGINGNVGQVIDGISLTMDTSEAFRSGRQHRVPYMAGATDYEGGLLADLGPSWAQLLELLGDNRQKALKAYYASGSLSDDVVRRMIHGDSQMIRPARYLAEQMSKVGGNGYVFNFSYVPEAVRSMTHGAWHGAEINYIFDTLDDRCREHGVPTSEDKAMSRRIRQYWINFAREGAPGTVDGVEWKPAGHGTLVFSKQGAQFSSDYLETRMKAIGSYEHPLVPNLKVGSTIL